MTYFNKYFPKDKFSQIKLVSTYKMFILTAGNLMIFRNKWSYNLSYQAWELRAVTRNALKHEKLNFMGLLVPLLALSDSTIFSKLLRTGRADGGNVDKTKTKILSLIWLKSKTSWSYSYDKVILTPDLYKAVMLLLLLLLLL